MSTHVEPPAITSGALQNNSSVTRWPLAWLLNLNLTEMMMSPFLLGSFLTALQSTWHSISGLLKSHITSAVCIDESNGLYLQVLKWMMKQQTTKTSRDLKASTQARSYLCHNPNSDDEDEADNDDVLDENEIFNFNKWASKIPPQYETNYGCNWFWHGGKFFMISHQPQGAEYTYGTKQQLIIRRFGRSAQPIKDLLDHIKKWTLQREKKLTIILRPEPLARGGEGWMIQSQRPVRLMSTVSLDNRQKANIIKDINEYLQPATARTYGAKGFPYRRGYLFHGPPGTGKTSLSLALAGKFGLPLYCIAMKEKGLTEFSLAMLFDRLPQRCIVLLEDIDAAGLRRDDSPNDSEPTASGPSWLPVGVSASRLMKNEMAREEDATMDGCSNISVSGLLNIIDGAASHQGRILIMTTNYKKDLDIALIRPGRVDLEIAFSFATHDQIRSMFKRMYSDDYNDDEEILRLLTEKPVREHVDVEKVPDMAERFADALAVAQLSPAEIQGYLLVFKDQPARALSGVEQRGADAIRCSKEGEGKTEETENRVMDNGLRDGDIKLKLG